MIIRLSLLTFTLIVTSNFFAPLISQAAEHSAPVKLGIHYDIFRDSTNDITITEILSGQYDTSFVPSTEKYLNFWHTDDTVWLRLNADEVIKNPDESHWLELIDKLESIEMFLIKEDGTYESQLRGFSNSGNQEIHFRSILFTINDPTVKEVYLKLEGSLPLTVISTLYTTTEFIKKIISYKFFVGIFYGFLSALSIYNLFLFFSLKEKACATC